MTTRAFEREFFGLARWMLGCNLRAMGGDVLDCKIPIGDLAFSLLGLVDYCTEMRFLCQEARHAFAGPRKPRFPTPPLDTAVITR